MEKKSSHLSRENGPEGGCLQPEEAADRTGKKAVQARAGGAVFA
ncbi:hypothetical protein [Desulfoluna sp.]|nr:hypothetical protein [Desulfoluna sp.]